VSIVLLVELVSRRMLSKKVQVKPEVTLIAWVLLCDQGNGFSSCI